MTMDRAAETSGGAGGSGGGWRGTAWLAAMFHAPGRAFAALRGAPAVAAVLVATAVLGAFGATVATRAVDPDAMAAQMAETQTEQARRFSTRDLSADEREQMLESSRTALRLTRSFAPVLGALSAVAAPLVAAACYLLAFGIMGVPGSYRLLLSTVLHAAWPALAVRTALTAAVVGTSGPLPPDRAEMLLRSNLASWLDSGPDGLSPVALAFASRVDVFLGWEIALLGIGFAITLGVPRRRAFGVVLLLWAVVTALTTGFAALTQSFGVGGSVG